MIKSDFFTALFSAVENGQSDKAKSILESTDVNVNWYDYPS